MSEEEDDDDDESLLDPPPKKPPNAILGFGPRFETEVLMAVKDGLLWKRDG